MPNCLIINGTMYEIKGEIIQTFVTKTVTTAFEVKLGESVLDKIEIKGDFIERGVVRQLN